MWSPSVNTGLHQGTESQKQSSSEDKGTNLDRQSSHLENSVFLRMIKNNNEEVTVINSYVKGTLMGRFSPGIWHRVAHLWAQ